MLRIACAFMCVWMPNIGAAVTVIRWNCIIQYIIVSVWETESSHHQGPIPFRSPIYTLFFRLSNCHTCFRLIGHSIGLDLVNHQDPHRTAAASRHIYNVYLSATSARYPSVSKCAYAEATHSYMDNGAAASKIMHVYSVIEKQSHRVKS